MLFDISDLIASFTLLVSQLLSGVRAHAIPEKRPGFFVTSPICGGNIGSLSTHHRHDGLTETITENLFVLNANINKFTDFYVSYNFDFFNT